MLSSIIVPAGSTVGAVISEGTVSDTKSASAIQAAEGGVAPNEQTPGVAGNGFSMQCCATITTSLPSGRIACLDQHISSEPAFSAWFIITRSKVTDPGRRVRGDANGALSQVDVCSKVSGSNTARVPAGGALTKSLRAIPDIRLQVGAPGLKNGNPLNITGVPVGRHASHSVSVVTSAFIGIPGPNRKITPTSTVAVRIGVSFIVVKIFVILVINELP